MAVVHGYKPQSRSPLRSLLILSLTLAVLSGLVLVVVWKVKGGASVSRAKSEIAAIVSAVYHYNSTYDGPPISGAARASVTPKCPDFTFGTMNLGPDGKTQLLKDKRGTNLVAIVNTGNRGYQNSNAEVMGILLDLVAYGNGNPTVNVDHAKNPQHIVFLRAKRTDDTVSPGIGLDGVYRDPWGNPYIITLDLNDDGRCRDALYRVETVSKQRDAEGWNGLHNNVDPGGFSSDFEAKATVMVWSFGPDGQADLNPANKSPNRDNVLSWK